MTMTPTSTQQSSNGHGLLNPLATADLLRQAMLHRSEEDPHDTIGSSSATPSGVATPRPDPTDKRLPGIMHGYFGQVGRTSTTSLDASENCALATPALEQSIASQAPEHHRSVEDASITSSATPDSAKPTAQEGCDPPVPTTASESREAPDLADAIAMLTVTAYPTPPISSPSSIYKENEEGGTTGQDLRAAEGGIAGCPSHGRQLSATDLVSLHTRRLTAGLRSLTAVVTDSSVHAAHLSNPTSARSSAGPSTPTHDRSQISAFSSMHSSYLELARLTENVSPRLKNTPPLTPRALSHEGTDSNSKSTIPTSNPTQSPPDESVLGSQTGTATPTNGLATETFPTPTPKVAPAKGRLSVKISEARGLRPSYDPYVVCVFEWNEYISKGPIDESSDEKNGAGSKEDRFKAVPIKRTGSDMARTMAIPMKSRQSSTTSLSDQKNFKHGKQVTDPKWEHEAVFDVVGDKPDIDFYVYDRSSQDTFLGHVRLLPDVSVDNTNIEGWFKLEPRDAQEESVSGDIHLRLHYQKIEKKHYGPEDFQILKLIGKGTFGQVYQVRKKDTHRIYAMKVLSKKVIVQKKEVAHTLGERNILVRTAMADSPFIVGLKFSFQTVTDLYLVTDFMSGGELFWHLQKEGRFNETRAKFYIAELILALEHLHQHDIVYRDLKPENILLDANGHIALCDFGLSKANLTKNDTTNTFCGTTEYLAPEVLLDEAGYTTMVDFWSLGVLVFEMCCGWSPFYADDTQQMYKNIAFGKVRFPRDAVSTEGRNFVKGLLNRNPKHRLGAINDAQELKEHPFFADVDWNALMKKTVVPPFKPKLKSVLDTSNFDPEFTNALQDSSSLNARALQLAGGAIPASTPLSPGMQANFKGFTFVDESNLEEHFRNTDLERMEEDDREGENDWEHAYDHRRGGDRMSGIIRTPGGDDGIFNNHFDD